MTAIFISYRRSDAGGHAGRLFDRLRQWFDEGVLFYDLDGIDAGDDFPARLEDSIRGAKVVLVLIGPDWVTTLNERAAKPSVDFVRREVELALKLRAEQGGLTVIPVLLGGALPPDGFCDALKPSLGGISGIDMHEFHGKQSDWDNQFVRLRDRIAGVPGVSTPRFRVPAGVEQPFRVIDHSVTPHLHDPNSLRATSSNRWSRSAP